MSSVRNTASMQARFHLLFRAKGSAEQEIKAGDLGQWSSPRSAKSLILINKVSPLRTPGRYRMRVDFRRNVVTK